MIKMNNGGKRKRLALWRRKMRVSSVVMLIILTSIVTSAIAGKLLTKSLTPADPGKTLKNSNVLNAALIGDSNTVIEIAKKVGPSIVGIRMTVRTSADQFFGGEEQSQAEGSGIIIRPDGYIMTNYHVVQYADPRSKSNQKVTLEVFLPDKRQIAAKFIGGDPLNDLAVIKIPLKKLPVAALGDSATLKVGALAVAIGNPLGLEFAGSVTTGVISALNRTVSIEDRTLNLIQTDAAINPGNSGGALLNSDGKVIGVNSIKISVSGVEGLGFAIPINTAKPIINQLIQYGYVKGRPFIGIGGQDITQEVAAYYNLPVGIYIMSVSPGSGAAKAGIRRKDILISLAGKKVVSMQDVNAIKRHYKAGDTVKAGIVRGKRNLTVNLTFTEEH